MQIYWTYEELLEQVTEAADEVLTLGNTVDGSPIVVAQSGGEKEPAIFKKNRKTSKISGLTSGPAVLVLGWPCVTPAGRF